MTAATERPLRAAPEEPQDPHDLDAERAVLGAALLKPDLIPELAGILRDDDWYRPAHTAIWHVITDLHAGGQPVDEITVHDQLLRANHLQRVGGVLYLHQLVEYTLEVHAATYHARIIAERAQQRRTRELGTWLQQAAATADPDTIRDRIDTHLTDRNPAQRAASSSWAPVELGPVLNGDRDPSPRPSALHRTDHHALLYPGVNSVAGEPTSGKSWLALLGVTQQISAGHDVLYIDFEDRPGSVIGRLLRIGAHPDHIRAHLRYIRPDTALDHTGRAALTHAAADTTLAVIDGVTEAMTMHGLSLMDNEDVARWLDLIPRRLADTGAAVLLIDHVVKDNERQGRWAIGGQHKVAGIDAAYTAKVIEPFGPGKRGTARIGIAKDRHGHIEAIALGRTAAEFHLDSTDPNISIATLTPAEPMPQGEAGQMRPTFLMEKVSRWLELRPGSSGKNIDDAKLGKASYVRQALQQLIVEGHIDVEDGPRGAHYHHVTTPYRNDQETTE